jgi:heme A synthase
LATLQSDAPSIHAAGVERDATTDRFLIFVLGIMIIGAIFQITFGGIVRVTESGLGCPDWPLCHGSIIPRWEYHTMIEWSHRTIGAIVGVFFVIATKRVWWNYRHNKFLLYSTSAASVSIAIVAGFGGAVVLSEVEPALRSIHLAIAEIVVLLTVLAFSAAVTGWTPSGISKAAGGAAAAAVESARSLVTIRRVTTLAAALALVTLLSGSYAVWRGAGAVCPGWPLCGGPIIPESELVWIHAIHRLTAAAATLVALYAAHRAYRLARGSRIVRTLSLVAMATVVVQVLVGAANPWTDFSEWAQVIHLSLATIMWTDLALLVAMLAMKPFEDGMTPERSAGP